MTSNDDGDPTMKERIIHELLIEGGPLTNDELARRLGRSQKAVGKRLTDLKDEGRIVNLGRKVGWAISDTTVSGPVAKKRLPKPSPFLKKR